MPSREELLNLLIKSGAVQTPSIINAFREVDRADFVSQENLTEAYEDRALPIGYGQTISQPTTVALMLEWLEPKLGQKILDVGSGSGWTTALLANIVGPQGKVIGTERIPELAKFGKDNLRRYCFNQANIVLAKNKLGLLEEAPFDRILVSAAANQLPQTLLRQLSIGGIAVIPVGNSIYKVTRRSSKSFSEEIHHGFIFVPLIEN